MARSFRDGKWLRRPFPTECLGHRLCPGPRVAIHSTPNIIRLATSRAVVTGAGPEKTPARLRFTAAMENFRLVPQLWHRVALIPTREPQFGQSWGRGCW